MSKYNNINNVIFMLLTIHENIVKKLDNFIENKKQSELS